MSEKLQQDHYKVKPKETDASQPYHAGRGAQFNTKNKFLKDEKTKEHIEGIDEWQKTELKTQHIETFSN